MILTEEEARTKFCPHMRVTGVDDSKRNLIPAHNILVAGNDNHYCKCEASKCMMWQWYIDGEWEKGEVGYCGLTSK